MVAYFDLKRFFLKLKKICFNRDIMQLFSVDATMLLKKINIFFAHENIKNPNRPQKLLIIGPKLFFQYCKPVQNQAKSQFLFHKNFSPRDLSIMTLIATGTLSEQTIPGRINKIENGLVLLFFLLSCWRGFFYKHNVF